MKYFIDTEFQEGFHKPLFGKRRHFIDLISIAIVAEDGREYYAISTDFNPRVASPWVKENVLSKLPERKVSFYDSPSRKAGSLLWKSNERIAQDIVDFIYKCEYQMAETEIQKTFVRVGKINPEFYAYYADYDWIIFCSLFGTMMDLPGGFPMYCRDLKQTLDESNSKLKSYGKLPSMEAIQYHSQSMDKIGWIHYDLKNHESYPKQSNEHCALDDARWSMDLYKFLKSINT